MYSRKRRSFEAVKGENTNVMRRLLAKSGSKSSTADYLPQNSMPSKLDSINGHSQHKAGMIKDYQQGSPSNEEEFNINNCAKESNKNTGNEIQGLSEECPQTRLEWYREFFDNRPLMRCLDDVYDESFKEVLYARLLKETRQIVGRKERTRCRRELNIRAWWDNVRGQLRDDDWSDEP